MRIAGPRLNARMTGSAAADWGTRAPDGTVQLDVRATLETDDGALIFVQYNGRVDFSDPTTPGPVYTTPRFETDDDRYACDALLFWRGILTITLAMAVRDVAKSASAAPPRTGNVNTTLTPATRSVRGVGAAVPPHSVTFDTSIATQTQQRALNDAPYSEGRPHSASGQRTTLGLSAARRSARLGPASAPRRRKR